MTTLSISKLSILFLAFGIFLIKTATALTCYSCDGGDSDACFTNPLGERNFTLPDDSNYYCSTYFTTSYNKASVRRSFQISEKNLTGLVKAGPVAGTTNPEENYLYLTYCDTEFCNDHSYAPPPKIRSTVKCYVCGYDDDNCARDVSSKYLIDADPIPSWGRTTSLNTSRNSTTIAEIEPPIGQFIYETYCRTMISKVPLVDKVIVRRDPWWFRKGEIPDEHCVTDGDTENCYCKTDGCNNKNGSEIVGKSLSVMIVLLFLRKLSL